jgi:hypothetical protein
MTLTPAAPRRLDRSLPPRGNLKAPGADRMLRDIAYVLHLTRKVKSQLAAPRCA